MTDTPASDPDDPWLPPPGIDRLREALDAWTVDSLEDLLGPRGRAALDRGDLSGAARSLARPHDRRLADLTLVFLLGRELDEAAARRALHPLSLDAAEAAGLVRRSAGSVRAGLEIRPYGEAGADRQWWVVSDLGADVRRGPLAGDHVLGVGSASLTLAQATPREPVRRALDVGTGCGVQALHLGRHSADVTATDVSPRALRCAATTAALSGQRWRLRRGSLLEPVAGERFDLVVANPPFVVSAGGPDGFDYRDSGLPGDAVCETLTRGIPDLLSEQGTAVLLANWVVRDEQGWDERVGSWIEGRGCDAWVWQREVAGPEEYVSLWLRDAGHDPLDPEWDARYDAWCAWFDDAGIAAVGMGLVALWRTEQPPALVFDDVRQAVSQPIADEIQKWHHRAGWLRERTDGELLAARLVPVADLVRTRHDTVTADGWSTVSTTLRQAGGMRWELDADAALTTLVAGLAAGAPLGTCLQLLAASLTMQSGAEGPSADEVTDTALPVVRDLIARGLLVPDGA